MIYCHCLDCGLDFDHPIRFERKWRCPRCLSREFEEIDTLYAEDEDEHEHEHEYDPNYKPWDM